MFFERFTEPARAVVVGARAEAQELGHQYIGTEHLLLALLAEQAGAASQVLRDAGLERPTVRAAIERAVGSPAQPLTDEDASALRTIGIDLDAVVRRIEESFGARALESVSLPPGRRGRSRRGLDRRFTRRAKKVLELSLREAVHLHDRGIGTEHILLGLIREGEGLAAKVMTDAGVSLDALRVATLDALGKAA
jgi:ATP-dependent Clp protease ATP-binding subunit ClpA